MIEYIIKLKKKTKNIFQDPWVWKMAWRDGRHNFSRLFLFMAALITGIAAVVAISSLNYSLQEELDRNAKELLGADFRIFPKRALAKVNGQRNDDDIMLGGEHGIEELGAAIGDDADFRHRL